MKEKITTGTNERPKEGVGQRGERTTEESSDIIDVGSDGEAKIREDHETGPAQPKPPRGTAVDDEDPNYSPMDERERIDAEQDGLGLTKRGPDGSIIEERDETSDLNKQLNEASEGQEDDTIPSDMPLRGSPD